MTPDEFQGECDQCWELITESECAGQGFHCESCAEWCPACEGAR